MTPEQVAEVLAARTPGPWNLRPWDDDRGRPPSRTVVPPQATGVGFTTHEDAAAVVVAVNLADEWQAVVEAARGFRTHIEAAWHEHEHDESCAYAYGNLTYPCRCLIARSALRAALAESES